MPRYATTVLAVIAAIAATSGFALQSDSAPEHSLSTAVRAFNQEAAANATGRTQPPLTEDEVIAAIRGWIPEYGPDVTDDVYQQFQEIAESRELPPHTEFSFHTDYRGYRGFNFKVWWIDLKVGNGKRTGLTGYTFRIRDQKISSSRINPE